MTTDELRVVVAIFSFGFFVGYVILLVRAKDKQPWFVLGLVMLLVALCSWFAKALTGVN